MKELAALFARGEKESGEIFQDLCKALDLDTTAGYGFASLEDAGLQGIIWLHFRASNLIKQRLWDKPRKLAQHMGSAVGALFRRRAPEGKK